VAASSSAPKRLPILIWGSDEALPSNPNEQAHFPA
jgi:hypothetical protein